MAYISFNGAETRYWVASQQQVPLGANVCVFGLYSTAKGGIVPSAVRPTRLIYGSIAEVASTLKSQAVTRGFIGLALISLPVIVYLMNR